jgi:CheY-like chemotaxis protein
LILAGDGYSFVEASSIESGLEAITGREGPHVVLLDLQLPDGNGREFIERLGKDTANYRIIVLTAHEHYLAAELAQELQIFRYLHKAEKIYESLRFTVSEAFKDIELEQLRRKISIFTRNPIKIFISYTNPDSEKVHWIYWRLKDDGFKPWMDQIDILAGANWKKQVQQAIDDCHFFLSCLSDISVKRLSYFRTETRLAITKQDRVGDPFILPLKFDDCEMPKEFAKRNIQCLNYDGFHNDWWLKLLKTLRSEN